MTIDKETWNLTKVIWNGKNQKYQPAVTPEQNTNLQLLSISKKHLIYVLFAHETWNFMINSEFITHTFVYSLNTKIQRIQLMIN